jgi:SPP1 family predicted phage head-tail adaptor
MTGSGKMNRRGTFQRATISNNAFNEPVQSWATLAEVWLNKADVSAGEALRAQEVSAELTTRFTVRYSATLASLTPKDRLLYGGDTFEITGVREKQRNRWIEVDCVRRAEV